MGTCYNRLDGTAEADQLHGHGGNDQLFGYEWSDSLYGGDGQDRLDGGAGADFMDGEHGSDTYVVDDLLDVIKDSHSYGSNLVLVHVDLHELQASATRRPR